MGWVRIPFLFSLYFLLFSLYSFFLLCSTETCIRMLRWNFSYSEVYPILSSELTKKSPNPTRSAESRAFSPDGEADTYYESENFEKTTPFRSLSVLASGVGEFHQCNPLYQRYVYLGTRDFRLIILDRETGDAVGHLQLEELPVAVYSISPRTGHFERSRVPIIASTVVDA